MTATRTGLRLTALGIILLLGAVTLPATHAQDSNKPTPAEGVTHLRDILVTAQKREQLIQDVPLPVTAFDAEQLDALKVRDLGDLTVGIPNVGLDEIGTSRGTREFFQPRPGCQ